MNSFSIEVLNNLAVTLNTLGKIDEAELYYKNLIKLKPDFPEVLFNLANTQKTLGKIDEAEKNYKKAIKLKKDFKDALFISAKNDKNQNKNEHAIKEFTQILEFDPKYSLAKVNLINLLDSYLPTNKNTHPIIIANNNLKKIKNTFSLENGIKKKDLANYSIDRIKIIKDKIGQLMFSNTQIYRKNSINLNCSRHHKAFNKFNIIPKFCFSCFKIQIEPKNVLELFKLYFIFDKF